MGHTISRSYCDVCAAELEISGSEGSVLALFPWEEKGPFEISAQTVVTDVRPDRAALSVQRSESYPIGTELLVSLAYLPRGLRKTGKLLCFNLPFEHASRLFSGPIPNPFQSRNDVPSFETQRSHLAVPRGWLKRRIERNGIANLESLLRETLGNGLQDKRVVLSNLEDSKAISLIQNARTLFLSISTPRGQPEEQSVLRFFAARGLTAERDRLLSTNGIPESHRRLEFRLSSDLHEISNLCKAIFLELYNLNEDSGIDISTLRANS